MKHKKIIRHSLSDQAENLIKERILSLDFEPGERMVVDKLADELGVSRTPIREGLRILAQQGLVNYDGKTYSIFNPGRHDIEEIFVIRKALEPAAAGLATKHISKEKIEDLHQLFEQHSSTNNEQTLVKIDIYFHDVIVSGAGNQRMERILSDMRSQFRLIRGWVAKRNMAEIGENINIPEIDTLNEHHRIFEYIQQRDPEGAAEAMLLHLEKGRERMIHNLFDPPAV